MKLGRWLGLGVSAGVSYYAGYRYGGPLPPARKMGESPEERDASLSNFGEQSTTKLIFGAGTVLYAFFGRPSTDALAQGSVVALGSYLIGEAILGKKTAGSIESVTTDVVTVDWFKTLREAKARCKKGNAQACREADIAAARISGVPTNTGKKPSKPPAPTPQATLKHDPAVANARRECSKGDNNACCWLKFQKNLNPPKTCRVGISGLNGHFYYPGDFYATL